MFQLSFLYYFLIHTIHISGTRVNPRPVDYLTSGYVLKMNCLHKDRGWGTRLYGLWDILSFLEDLFNATGWPQRLCSQKHGSCDVTWKDPIICDDMFVYSNWLTCWPRLLYKEVCYFRLVDTVGLYLSLLSEIRNQCLFFLLNLNWVHWNVKKGIKRLKKNVQILWAGRSKFDTTSLCKQQASCHLSENFNTVVFVCIVPLHHKLQNWNTTLKCSWN